MTKLKHPGFKKLTLKSLLTISGGLIIFGSWVAQQHQTDTAATTEKLKRSQLVIDIEEVARTVNEIEYTKQSLKKPTEPVRLALAQTNLADCYMRLLTWSQGRIDDSDTSYTNLVNLKNASDSANRSALLTQNYSLIDSNFNKASARFQKDFQRLDQQFTNRYHGAEQDDSISFIWFIISYGLGSGLLGISYLLKGE